MPFATLWKQPLEGIHPPHSLFGSSPAGFAVGNVLLGLPDSDELPTSQERPPANRNVVPTRKRHRSLFLDSLQHLEKEPGTSAVKHQMEPEQAFECCDFFPGFRGLFPHRPHLFKVKSPNLAEQCGRISSPEVEGKALDHWLNNPFLRSRALMSLFDVWTEVCIFRAGISTETRGESLSRP